MFTSDAAVLEALVPGFDFISRIFMSYLHIDISTYFQVLLGLTMFGATIRYGLFYIWERLGEFFISTAEIRQEDEVFNYLMHWISHQPQMEQTARFVAGVNLNDYMTEGDNHTEDDYDLEDKSGWEEESPGSVKGSQNSAFDLYWAQFINRNKYKTLRITPAVGSHYFWYKNRPLMLTRSNQEIGGPYMPNERLYLSCFGWNPKMLKELLREAQQTYVKRDGNRTVIYRSQRYPADHSFYWNRWMTRVPRPLSTVILDHSQKERFIDDIKEYLHPRTERWYSNRGIPYRRGYLLQGPPGTGKTSLCFAAAGLLRLELYLVDLNSTHLDEESLSTLFSHLPPRCIVLLEDIDSAGITKTRGAAPTRDTPKLDAILDDTNGSGDIKAGTEETKTGGVTLSGLLNVIDGVAATEGRILVMTTNHADKLDPALRRPGRVDMEIVFDYTSEADIKELFMSIYVPMENDIARAGVLSKFTIGSEESPKKSNLANTNNARGEIDQNSNNTHGVGKKDDNTELQIHDKNLRSRISDLAAEFATIVPAGEITAADIQGYLLDYKEAPTRAIESAKEWVEAMPEKKHTRRKNERSA